LGRVTWNRGIDIGIRPSKTALVDSFTRAYQQVIDLTPRVVAMLAVIVIGYIAARLVARAITSLSEKIGLQSLKKDESEVFLGRDLMRQAGYSNETAKNVDDEVKRIVMECYKRSKDILTSHKRALDAIAAKLIEKEVIDAAEMVDILKGLEGAAA